MTKDDRVLNSEDIDSLKALLKYSEKYEISIQFWPFQICVYIAKDGVDLTSFGGDKDSLSRAVEYLNRINKKK